jgi:hypothetical protein
MKPTTAISIITCKRDKATYLGQTAAALLRAGADECTHRWVLIDGDSDPVPPGWEPETWWPRAGTRMMMWRAFETALKAGVDQLIYCEDDVTPCRNAIRYIARMRVPPARAFVDFYCGRKELPETPGVHDVPAIGFSGTQCFLISRQVMAWLMSRDPLAVMPDQRYGHIYTGSDMALAAHLMESPWSRYLVHLPRLVQHDGDVSIAHPRKGERRRPFPGEDFDALSLLPQNVPGGAAAGAGAGDE